MTSARHDASPFVFLGLVFLVSVPFWLLGTIADRELLPGLPVSAVMVICPALTAAGLVARAGGRSAVWSFFRAAADWRRMRGWAWLVALGTMPAVMLLAGLLQVALGQSLPPPQIDLAVALALFVVFFVAATAEELGWTGYATRPLAAAYGWVGAGLIIGAAAIAWHLLPLLQAERNWTWIAWWALGTGVRRIVIVWLYMRGGQSVFSASLFHTMSNVSWMMFPVMGSHYDPMMAFLALVAVTTGGVLVHALRTRRM